jgi:hypothetical protein
MVSKQQCDAGRPCVPTDASKVFVKLDVAARRYQRCDRLGCDAYTPEIAWSGGWTNITLPRNAMLARLDARGAFVEVATLGGTVLVSHGQCRADQQRTR